ncbi:MAG: hypothetical protein WEA82_09980 [Idiomarina sp.]
MTADEDTTFKTITPDPTKYYRISWFGAVSYFDGKKVRPTPVIEIFILELETPPPYFKLELSSFKKYTYSKVAVPVALLGVLKLGDIWHDSALYQTADAHHEVASFNNTLINRGNTKTITARSQRESAYWLPIEYHPYHIKNTSSTLEVIELNKKESIIIPHIVIIQTFFAPDTFVLTQSFKMDLKLDSLFDSSKTFIDKNTKHAFIQLRKNVYDSSHKICAMLAFDDIYQEAYKRVSKILAAQKNKNFTSLIPQTSIPIAGKHNLSLVGKWMYSEEDGHSSFIVFQMLSVSMSPPFIDITFFRDAPGDLNPNAEPGENRGGKGPRKPPKDKPKPDDVDPDKDPNGDYEPITTALNSVSFFPDLHSTPSRKERQEAHKNEEVNEKNQGTGDPKGVGAGGLGDDDSQGWGGTDSDEPPLQPTKEKTYPQRFSRVELFVDVLDSLVKKYSTKLSLHSKMIYEFPKVEKNNRLSTWDNLNYHRGQNRHSAVSYRARRVLISRIVTTSGQSYYLFETERKMKLASNGWYEVDRHSIMILKSEDLSEREISAILESTVNHRGWSLNGKPLAKQIVQHLKREQVFKPEYAIKLSERIKKAIEKN